MSHLLHFKQFLATLKPKENEQDRVKNLAFFFRYQGKIFGAPEESRIVFARLKNPKNDDEATPEWIKRADFSGFNLEAPTQEHLFTKKDLKDITVIPAEEALKALKR